MDTREESPPRKKQRRGEPAEEESLLCRLPMELLMYIIHQVPEDDFQTRGRFLSVCHLFYDMREKILDISVNVHRPLWYACRKGYANVVEKLLQDPRLDNPSIVNHTAIEYASHGGHEKVVELLLKHLHVGIPRALHGGLVIASEAGQVDVIRILLDHPRADPSLDKQRALFGALLANQANATAVLLKDSRVDPMGCIRNFLAVIVRQHGISEALEVLLRDRKMDALRKQKNIALQVALVLGRDDSVRILIEVGHATLEGNEATFPVSREVLYRYLGEACRTHSHRSLRTFLLDERIDAAFIYELLEEAGSIEREILLADRRSGGKNL